MAAMQARRDVIENELAVIKAKLEQVRAHRHLTGEYADPDWYRRATSRARFLGVEHQRITRAIAEQRRTHGRARTQTVAAAFVSIAKDRLSSLEFDTIMAKAVAATEGDAHG